MATKNKLTEEKKAKLVQKAKLVLQEIATLAIRNIALRAYFDYHSEHYADVSSVHQLRRQHPGDSLAVFLWQEMGDAGGDAGEALRMAGNIVREVGAVADAMYLAKHDPEELKRRETCL